MSVVASFFSRVEQRSIDLALYQAARTMPRNGEVIKLRCVIVALHDECLL